MNIFKFIDSCVSRKQLPYVRLITVYLHNGAVTNVCLCRYTDKHIVKKAAKVGLDNDRLMTLLGAGVKIENIGNAGAELNGVDLQNGDYYLNYSTKDHEITIYKA